MEEPASDRSTPHNRANGIGGGQGSYLDIHSAIEDRRVSGGSPLMLGPAAYNRNDA